MKKLVSVFIIAVCIFSLAGCNTTPQEVYDIEKLKSEITELQAEKTFLEENLAAFKEENDAYQYIVTINIKQSHFTLDIGQHIKDGMNDIDIDIPVSKLFYDSIEVGDVLDDSFRMGSFIMKGSFGSWDITIKDKNII